MKAKLNYAKGSINTITRCSTKVRWTFLIGLLFVIPCVYFAKENKPIVLKAVQTSMIVDNKYAQVYALVQENGAEGFTGIKGKHFNVILKNDTKVPISIHWHGLILPNNQDGVAFVTQLPIPPGGSQHYDFPLLQSGTYWMHSHYRFHEQELMAAPLIIQDPSEPYSNYKNVIIMLQDFSFKKPEKIFSDLKQNAEHAHKMNMQKPDLNDINYDAFLANRRTIINPQIIHVTPGEKIRLRLINASSATNYWINTGKLAGTLIAVDGASIVPINNQTFQIAIAQRLDILITIPPKGGCYPILAQVEGLKKQSGILLITPNAPIIMPAELAAKPAIALDDKQELQLHSLHPLLLKPITKVLRYSLEGNMQEYIWTINHEIWPQVKPFLIKKGDRVAMIFTNNTEMSHPMHLHGHVFQVTNINGTPIKNGPLRDTILVLPHSTKTIIFDADNPGIWAMHCHLLYHMVAGMMTTTNYQGFPAPSYYLDLLKQKSTK